MKVIKHICFISAGLAGGGMERSLTNIANYAASSGYKVTILNLFKTEVFFTLHPDISLIWPQIDRHSTHRLLYAVKLIPYIRQNLKRVQPDTVLSFGEWFNAYVIIATRFMKIPVYVSDRMGPNMFMGYLLENARKITYRYADGVIAQTSVAATILLKKTGAKNIKIIPNGVNCTNITKKEKKKQIVTVGRLSREKGHIILLKAFVKLPCFDWSLHIVGDGPERKKLTDFVLKNNLEARVHFYGHLKEFNEILASSEIFVLPSLYEGFPNSLLEAMCIPLACISTDCVAGPSEIIVNFHNGLLVKPGDDTALADAIHILVENENLRNELASNSLAVREKYNNNTISQRYLNYICDNEF